MTSQPPSVSRTPPELKRTLSREHRRAALLERAPWLEPLLDRALRGDRLDPALGLQLERILEQFEELPDYALSAIATLLRDEERAPKPVLPEREERSESSSTEGLLDRRQALQRDPAFALAVHCVGARLGPALAAIAANPLLARVPEDAWLGLLHAGARAGGPLLTPSVSVLLVLRVSSPNHCLLPQAARAAALRLFGAKASDLRAERIVARLCADLPASWAIDARAAIEFVAAAGQLRQGLADSISLCARLANSARARTGGLAALEQLGTESASPAELAEVRATALAPARAKDFASLLHVL
jgi:hypothetical protein